MMGMRLSSMKRRAVSRTRRSSSLSRVSKSMKSTPRNFRAMRNSILFQFSNECAAVLLTGSLLFCREIHDLLQDVVVVAIYADGPAVDKQSRSGIYVERFGQID